MTDDQLLKKLQRGDQEALTALMEKYRRYILTVVSNVMGRAGSLSDAEELTQDVFYAIWGHSDHIQPGKLKAYLCITARNRAKDYLRSHRDLPMDLDELPLESVGDSPEDQILRKERARQVKKAIAAMVPKDREIFLRYYYYLQTAEQIGSAMDIPPSTVRSRLARGRRVLKKKLEAIL